MLTVLQRWGAVQGNLKWMNEQTRKGKMRRKGQPEENVLQHVGRIGNLLLLPIALNQQAKTKPFADKKAIYEKHNLRMIKAVCTEDDWTLDQIEARESAIIAWAKSKWADL